MTKVSLPIKFTPAKETTITVASVINDCKDASAEECPLYVYDTASGNRFAVTSVDTSLNGAVDINICLGPHKAPQRTWRIKYVGENQEEGPLYWSNIEGFCSYCYTLFTEDEHNTFELPMDGEWEVVCDYPRTIMEFVVELESIIVIIHQILTDEERQKLIYHWQHVLDDMKDNPDDYVRVADVTRTAMEFFNYEYEICEPDHVYYV